MTYHGALTTTRQKRERKRANGCKLHMGLSPAGTQFSDPKSKYI